MKHEQLIREIEQIRQSLIRTINSRFSELVSSIEILDGDRYLKGVERTVPLASDPGIFNKEKPSAIIIGNERIVAPTWKSVYLKLLSRLCNDPSYYERLLELRGVSVGRGRSYLSGEKEGMTHPKKIADGLYAETHYSSSQLMRILVQRIMDVIQYDYTNISIAMR